MKRLFVIFSLILLLGSHADALFYKGAEGDDVRELQQGLYRAGYYDGVWDGKYTERVCEAVKAYQRDNGIFPDGICSYAVARALGARIRYDKRDGDAVMIGRLVYKICKNDDYLTKLAVASVAVNRLDSPLFPDDMASVIETLGGAFPCELPEDCIRAAYEALCGAKPYGDILYFERSAVKRKSADAAYHNGFIFRK